jgi:hypothetical protein
MCVHQCLDNEALLVIFERRAARAVDSYGKSGGWRLRRSLEVFRKVLDVHAIAASHHAPVPDRVLKLPDVTRPTVTK